MIVESFIYLEVQYGSKTWVLNKADRDKLEIWERMVLGEWIIDGKGEEIKRQRDCMEKRTLRIW